MASVNKVIIVGTCGRDPEVRYTTNGKAVANVSLATNSRWKDKNGETQEETQWHRITFYDKLAEIAGEYLKKGRQAYVEGSLKYGKYTDQAGVEKNTVEIVARELILLGGRDGGNRQHGDDDGDEHQQQQHRDQGQQRPQQAPQGQGYRQQQRPQGPQGGGQQRPQQAPAQRSAAQAQGGGGGGYNAPGNSSGFDPMDDDIPFASLDNAIELTYKKGKRIASTRRF